jgi:serine phosphatase RsbU (regulator of sigma subunit)
MKPDFTFLWKFLSFIFLLLSYLPLQAQENTIDSLENLLKTTKADTAKVNLYNNLFLQYEFSDYEKARNCLNKALDLSKKTDYQKGLATTYQYLGFFAEDTGNYHQAIKHYLQSLEISEIISDKKGLASIQGNIGNSYYFQGDYPNALDYYFKALKLAEELNDNNKIAKQLGNIGNVYKEQTDYLKALDYYFKALKIAIELDNKNGIAADYGSIGNVFKEQADESKIHKDSLKSDSLYKKSLNYSFKALKIFEELKDESSIAIQLSNIGNVYQEQNNYQKALDFSFRALKIDEELGNKIGIATDFGNIGSSYTSLKNYPEAEKYLLQAITIADSLGILKEKMQFETFISDLYTKTGKYKEAFDHYKTATNLGDTLLSQDKSRKISNYEFEKKEAAAKAEQDKKDALSIAESRKQRIIIWAVIIVLLLVIVFFVFLYNRYRVTQKQKKIIENQKLMVEEKNKIIEEKNKDITDSITYAKRIQQAVLPSGNYANNILGDHFILFKPKDIVSGDFYWGTRINELLIVTVADCTGHGVPGAFMSMLGVSSLNEIVRKKEVTKASEIINQLRESIIESLQQKGASGEQKDGMDMSLCAINTSSNQLQFAGANNPLFIVSAQKQLKVIEANKMPVAIYEHMENFTNQEYQLQKGDCLYLCSDGYEDQFGGPKGKKFMIKHLKELFVTISDKPLIEQQKILDLTFENWRGEHEQIDDVTIIGIRI